MQAIEFIKKSFREYYSYKGVKGPYDMDKREFGFGDIKKIDYRHMHFKNDDELNKHFTEKIPLYASYSAGYYEFPDARPMSKKNLLDADLIFEFDVEPDENSMNPINGMKKAKEDTIHLIEDFLIDDFGVNKQSISVNFSGNRGYHIHVFDKEMRSLSANARREIIGYIKPSPDILMKIYNPSNEYGWHMKIKKSMSHFFNEMEKDPVAYKMYKQRNKDNNMEKRWADALIQNKKTLLNLKPKGGYKKSVDNGVEVIIKDCIVNLTADVDEPVTFDMSRLIRLPDTLHGGTGFLASRIKNLDEYDPFVDSVVFYNPPIKIKLTKDCLPFELKEEKYGPYKAGEETKLPQYAALYLLCKGVAEPNEL